MKVALVYDRINRVGGAERIVTALEEIFPQAPIFTFVYDPKLAHWAAHYQIRSSFWSKIPFLKSHHEWLPGVPFFTFAKFNFSSFDLVISVTSAEAKDIKVRPPTKHVCICLTPTRYLWSHYQQYFANPIVKALSLPLISVLRLRDFSAAQKPDLLIAISHTVARRIKKYYRRQAEIIYPPVDTKFFYPAQNPRCDFFLIVGRLVKYKRFDIAVTACKNLNLPLKVVGQGPQLKFLKKIAGPKTEFVSHLTDAQLRGYYQKCTALIFPQEEDFGITAVEALACGKSVIGYHRGGAAELIEPGVTGELFAEQNVASLTDILKDFDYNKYQPQDCRKQAEKFGKERFKRELTKIINNLL